MVTVLISTVFRGAALIRGRRLFQCGHPKVPLLIRGQRLFDARRLLEEIRYRNPDNFLQNTSLDT